MKALPVEVSWMLILLYKRLDDALIYSGLACRNYQMAKVLDKLQAHLHVLASHCAKLMSSWWRSVLSTKSTSLRSMMRN
jgi:hypothetical protein